MRARIWTPILFGALLVVVTGNANAQEMRVRSGWLGFTYEAFAEDGEENAHITRVYPGSPAAEAGVREGDEIIRVNGRTDVATALDAQEIEPGDTIRMRVRRDVGRDSDVAVVAARRPNNLAVIAPTPRRVWSDDDRREDRMFYRFRPDSLIARVDSLFGRNGRVFVWPDSLFVHADSLHRGLELMLRDSLGPKLREFSEEFRAWVPEGGARSVITIGRRSVAGAEFEEMNPGLSAYFGTDEGALVLRVAPGTPAARAGLQPGDVVLEANDREVDSVDDLRNAVSRAQGMRPRAVQLEILRQGRRQDIDLRWE